MSDAEERIAIFPGTFDPFTIGHANIVKRALTCFDKLIIAIGVNDNKRTYFTTEQRQRMIAEYYKNNPHVIVLCYDCMTIDFAKEVKATHMIRGIRTVADMEYERSIADVNYKLSGIDTLLLFTEPELTSISSSIVREFLRYGEDISMFLPEGFKIEIEKEK